MLLPAGPHLIATMQHPTRSRGFTLIELLVTVSIIAILIGILMPVIARVRGDVEKTSCAGNLRQVGIAITSHRTDHSERLPTARYMPDPFLSADDDPGLPEALESYIPYEDGKTSEVWRCPDDGLVYELCGTSYDYASLFSGQRVQDIFFIKMGFSSEEEIILSRDFDNAAADVSTSDEPLEVPARHLRRNNLWLDGRVEVIDNDEFITGPQDDDDE